MSTDDWMHDTDDIEYDRLYSNEIRWRDRQRFLQSQGYMLRPRLRPGWTPSWLTTGKHPLRSEDGFALPMREHLVDATRISDGKLVYIKRVKTGDRESAIALMLSSERLRHDSRNHSVPILDTFVDDDDPNISYVVMPFLRSPKIPDFQTVAEVIDFVDQILEGLVFMHEQGVAHRDCALPNILMDASAMYPQGFHPIRNRFSPDGFTLVYEIPRNRVRVQYYYIDYGISSYYPPDQPRGLVTGTFGREQDVPELSNTVPYDPFAVDIFIIGSLLLKEFYKEYSNLGFLKPVISLTTQRDPSLRPNAAELLKFWTKKRREVPQIQRNWRLRSREENIIGSAARDCFKLTESLLSVVGSFFRSA